MSQPDLAFVRTEQAETLPAPISNVGAFGWMREHLFSGLWNTVLTILGLYILYLLIPPLLNFAIFDAIWTGEDREACLATAGGHVGACWPYVDAKLDQFIYGRYPIEERWRVNIVFLLGFLGLVPLAIPAAPFKRFNAIFFFGIYPVISVVLLTGGGFGHPAWLWALIVLLTLAAAGLALLPVFVGQAKVEDQLPALGMAGMVFAVPAAAVWLMTVDFGLEPVETPLWGGILVTLVIAVTGIVASLPIGILLALGRRSDMPMVRLVCIIFIEFWRGVPLITILFMSSVMLPLFLPENVTFDKLLRALIGVAFFASAYMAEVVRGGLQAIPNGQYEGARALGLGYWQMMNLIVLPQALKLVIPGIVNTFIGLFKDTTLVLIIGLFDLLGTIQLSFTDPKWSTPVTSHTGYLFAAIFYWIFCYGMSRYSLYMEKKLSAGERR
ncbi:MAG: amino acid ABC transporter permease [Hyphomicrobiales bacterium]|nr:amino acid ABC transporter permease [Hyphomicrobiales bacterium]